MLYFTIMRYITVGAARVRVYACTQIIYNRTMESLKHPKNIEIPPPPVHQTAGVFRLPCVF